MSEKSESNINNVVNQSINAVKQEGQVVAAGSLSLEMEADHIKRMYQKVFDIDRGLVEQRVWFWRALGDVLYIHRDHVIAAGHPWQEWATKHFRKLGHTRREQCIALTEYGASLEVFYFLGIDFLYPFANLMSAKFVGDPEIKRVSKFFRLNVGANIIHVDQTKYRIDIEKMYEYFKFKNKMSGAAYDRDMVLDVIDTGVVFNNHDYKSLKDLASNPAGQYKYLFEMRVNVGSPKGPKQSVSQQDSMLNVMANFIVLADKHISSGKFPSYLTKSKMHPFLKKVDQYNSSLPK
jgi:hypothetical protein